MHAGWAHPPVRYHRLLRRARLRTETAALSIIEGVAPPTQKPRAHLLERPLTEGGGCATPVWYTGVMLAIRHAWRGSDCNRSPPCPYRGMGTPLPPAGGEAFWMAARLGPGLVVCSRSRRVLELIEM